MLKTHLSSKTGKKQNNFLFASEIPMLFKISETFERIYTKGPATPIRNENPNDVHIND